MFNSFSNSLSKNDKTRHDNNSNNNNNNKQSAFSLMSATSEHSGLAKRRSTGVMRMNDASFDNDPFCGFDNNVKLSSGYKSVNVESGAMGNSLAFRSLSDGLGSMGANLDEDVDYDAATFSRSGSVHRGATAFMPLGGGMGGMDELEGLGASLGSLSSLGSMSMIKPFGGSVDAIDLNKSSETNNVPKKQSLAPQHPILGISESEPLPKMHSLPMPSMKPMEGGVNFVPAKVPQLSQDFLTEDEDDDNSMDIFMPPSKVLGSEVSSDDCSMAKSPRKDDGCFVKPSYYNEYTTCTMENCPKDVLNGVKRMCERYGDEKAGDKEMDFCVNEKEFNIEGTCYVKHKPVKFVISIWHDSDSMDNLTRVEFQKRRGDSVLFQQFWSEMLEMIHKEFTNVCGAVRCQDFESFFMPPFDLEDNFKFSDKELDNMAADLREDYRDEALDVLAMLCEEMDKSDFCQLVAVHVALIEALVKITLSHYDVCHIRGGLCALSKMVAMQESSVAMLIEKTIIMSQLVLLLQSPSELIQKRAIQLMAQLSNCKGSWNLKGSQYDLIEEKLVEMSSDAHGSLKNMLKNIRRKVDSDRLKQ